MPRWLARQVGESGRVLATDLDTRWLPAGEAGFEVLRHEAGVDPVPPGAFDLVHARLLLVHLPRRAEVLASLVDVLRPGGWLVIEDAHCVAAAGLPGRVRTGAAVGQPSADGDSRSAGRPGCRPGVRADPTPIATRSRPGGGPGRRVLPGQHTGSPEPAGGNREPGQRRPAGCRTGHEAEIDQHLADLATGQLDLATAPLISAGLSGTQ